MAHFHRKTELMAQQERCEHEFGWYPVRISVELPLILTDTFCSLPQPVKANARYYLNSLTYLDDWETSIHLGDFRYFDGCKNSPHKL